MESPRKSPPVICTDDAWFMIATEAPLTVEIIREKMLGLYEGTPAALWWAVGDHEVYHHETEVGERFGEGYDDIEPARYHSMHSEFPGAAPVPLDALGVPRSRPGTTRCTRSSPEPPATPSRTSGTS